MTNKCTFIEPETYLVKEAQAEYKSEYSSNVFSSDGNLDITSIKKSIKIADIYEGVSVVEIN